MKTVLPTLAVLAALQGAALGVPDSPMPGLGAAYGTFTVRIRNDCKPGDGQLTGVALDTTTGSCDPAPPGAPTRDGNCKLIVAPTATVGTTTLRQGAEPRDEALSAGDERPLRRVVRRGFWSRKPMRAAEVSN